MQPFEAPLGIFNVGLHRVIEGFGLLLVLFQRRVIGKWMSAAHIQLRPLGEFAGAMPAWVPAKSEEVIRCTTCSPRLSFLEPIYTAPIFSKARLERKFCGPTRNITLFTNRKAWRSMRCFISRLYTPPQWERARKVQPI